jgi:hypothetical protein
VVLPVVEPVVVEPDVVPDVVPVVVLPVVLPEVVPVVVLPEVLPDVVPVVVLPDVVPLVLPEVPSVPVPVVAQALMKESEAQRAAPISRESWLRFICMKMEK